MKVIRSKEFEGTRPWEALHIATLSGTTVRLHWTDKPYIWHVNDGQEVFAVLDGVVDMCQVPDDWLLHNRRALLFGREVLKAVMAAFTPGSQAA